jgi:biopolymer transport protein ExbD
MAGGGGGGEGEPEFQVAPMIDVLLTILIFFMTITSAQVLRVDKSIKLPVAPQAQKKATDRAEAIINVRWKAATHTAEVVFDDKVYARVEDLTPILKPRHDADPKYRAVIRGDENVPAESISQVMNACGEAGISDIAFSALNKS